MGFDSPAEHAGLAPKDGGRGATRGPLVLCADDDEDILALVALQLEQAGCSVLTAGDGATAVELVRARRPEVVVLDVMMPRGGGLDVLRELRADPSLARVRVLLLSARVQDGDVEEGLAAGADAYLAKPFRARELVERVQALLDAGQDRT